MSLKMLGETQNTIINYSAGGDSTVIALVVRQRISVFALVLVVTAATTITFKSSVAGAISAPFALAANGSIVLDVNSNGDPWWVTTISEALVINSSAATQVSGNIYTLQGP